MNAILRDRRLAVTSRTKTKVRGFCALTLPSLSKFLGHFKVDLILNELISKQLAFNPP